MREGGFPAPDEPLDDGGLGKAARHRLARSSSPDLVSSPASAARQTADCLGSSVAIDAALRDIDHGDWAGRSFAAIGAEALAAWLADPAAGTPGGETFASVQTRLSPWLDEQRYRDIAIIAVTHPTVIRIALAIALDMPIAVATRIDIAPLATVELSFNRIWRLQAIRPA